MLSVFEHTHHGPVLWAIVVMASSIAAVTDIRSRRIPNVLTFPLFASGLFCAMMSEGWDGLGNHFLACVLLATPFVVLFLFAGGGAGDAKLMGAIGAWLGCGSVVTVLIAVMVSGVVVGLSYAVARQRLRAALLNIGVMSHGLVRLAVRQSSAREAAAAMPDSSTMLKMPYGVAICAGVCAAAFKVLIWNF